ncbi:dicarboxylate/amino acid:cation symporter [Enterococcus sp. AZ196]|uniref:dicarboxylate/amino acid:cation symporter n=1 Tax=Enterococcus sp. AZ196 TaxID=2774659 RepID=UPI003D2A1A85
MKYIANYKSSLLLLLCIGIGGLVGIIFPESSVITYPVGSIYLNFLYVLVTPLIFFSVITAIISTKTVEKAKHILFLSMVTFLLFSLAASLIALLLGISLPSMVASDSNAIINTLPQINEKVDFTEKIIRMLSVKNLPELFQSENMIPLLLFSALAAASIRKLGNKAKLLKELFSVITDLLYTMISTLMKFAPIGFGCYFSYSIGQTGAAILKNYAKIFLLFLLFSILFYFIFYSIVIYFSGGVAKVKLFWRFNTIPSLTAVATASSSACIPANLTACDQLGIDRDVSSTIIPLGANIHKDGATGASVLKILLILELCNIDYMNFSTLVLVILTAILSGIVMGTVPGGGVSAAILMISIFNLPNEMMSIIILLSTVFDIPATLLNSVGNIPSAMIVDRMIFRKRNSTVL